MNHRLIMIAISQTSHCDYITNKRRGPSIQLKSSQNISENKYFVNTKVVINSPSSLLPAHYIFLGGLGNGCTIMMKQMAHLLFVRKYAETLDIHF